MPCYAFANEDEDCNDSLMLGKDWLLQLKAVILRGVKVKNGKVLKMLAFRVTQCSQLTMRSLAFKLSPYGRRVDCGF